MSYPARWIGKSQAALRGDGAAIVECLNECHRFGIHYYYVDTGKSCEDYVRLDPDVVAAERLYELALKAPTWPEPWVSAAAGLKTADAIARQRWREQRLPALDMENSARSRAAIEKFLSHLRSLAGQ